MKDVTLPPTAFAARRLLWVTLLRHEWRLVTRDGLNGTARRREKVIAATAAGAGGPAAVVGGVFQRDLKWFGLVAFQIILHLVGATMLFLPTHWSDTSSTRLAAIGVLAFLVTFMLSSTMSRVVTAFHERRDLDLLLGAPISATLILSIRVVTIALATTATFAFFVFPFVDTGVVLGRWWLARLWLLVPLLALMTTGLALSLTDLFVRLVGVRRARVGLQVFSALTGASVYLVSQARQFLPRETAARLNDWFASVVRVDDAPWPVEAVARMARGDLVAWAALVVVGVAIFIAAVRQAQRRFVDVAQTPEADGRVTNVPRATVDRRFDRGFGRDLFTTLLLKEWRLVLRAPQLISQVLLQMLYLFPLIFVGFSHGGTMRTWSGPALASGIVAVAATLSTSLAWLTISGEDAPDLLAGSPRRRSIIVGAKIVAATSPPVLAVLVGAIGIGVNAPVDGGLVLVYGVLSCTSAAIIAAASPSPGKRSDFQRRHNGRMGSGLIEMLQFLAWAGAAGAAVGGHPIVATALTLVALAAPTLLFRRALGVVRDG